MSAIGKGDWVECVHAPNSAKSGFRVGAIYCVSDVGNEGGLAFYDMPRPHECGFLNSWFWKASAFRPTWRGDKTLIETLLEPVADPVTAEVRRMLEASVAALAEAQEPKP